MQLTYITWIGIIYCVARAGIVIYFGHWQRVRLRAAGEGCISLKTDIAFPHGSHIIFFVTPLPLSDNTMVNMFC